MTDANKAREEAAKEYALSVDVGIGRQVRQPVYDAFLAGVAYAESKRIYVADMEGRDARIAQLERAMEGLWSKETIAGIDEWADAYEKACAHIVQLEDALRGARETFRRLRLEDSLAKIDAALAPEGKS